MLRHILNELQLGLRRNISMHLAVILTLFVSLTMVGLGLLAKAEADKAAAYWGDQLQITVWLCNQDDTTGTCSGEVTGEQRTAIMNAIEESPEVAQVEEQSKQDAYNTMREFLGPDEFQRLSEIITADGMRESLWITLKKPDEYEGVISAVKGLDGVQEVRDVRQYLDRIYNFIDAMRWGSVIIAGLLVVAALLLVGNTVRLAALARRREIAIMRLVGASSLYIAIPFLMEALVTALLSVLLTAGAMALIIRLGVMEWLSELEWIPWVGWPEYFQAMAIIAVIGPILTVLPTLVLTRKYLRV